MEIEVTEEMVEAAVHAMDIASGFPWERPANITNDYFRHLARHAIKAALAARVTRD